MARRRSVTAGRSARRSGAGRRGRRSRRSGMPEWVDGGRPEDELVEVRAELGGLSTLAFLTPRDHPAYRRAQRLDALLMPVRARAREALGEGPTREAIEECWRLVDEAGETIDRAGWWLHRGNSTRLWAERHVAAAVRAAKKRPRRPLK